MSLVQSELVEGGRVLRIVIDNPKGNVLTGAVMQSLGAALAEHEHDKKLAFVTLQGAGKHFSFGASVEEHRQDQVTEMLTVFHDLIRRIARYPVPIAALVSGRCLGGAFEVALACHFVIADESAVFACPEIQLGVFPPVLAVLGPLRLGQALSERLLLTGGELAANNAMGFVSELLPGGGDLEGVSLELYKKQLAPLSSYSLRQATLASRKGSGIWDAVGEPLTSIEMLYLEQLVSSHDGNEGIGAFLEKRKPAWTHQ